jgi:hypothetical protein
MNEKNKDSCKCIYGECNELAKSRGYCKRHYTEMYRKKAFVILPAKNKSKCKVNGCSKNVLISGMCGKHYQRFRKHGDVLYADGKRHGMTSYPEHSVWMHMIERCVKEKTPCYKDYGGRGIKVCDRWLGSFKYFYEDMGSRPKGNYELDRIDNDGNYSPDNCRWVTRTTNARNKRSTKMSEAKVKEFFGLAEKGFSVYKLSKIFGISYTNAKDIANRRIWKCQTI